MKRIAWELTLFCPNNCRHCFAAASAHVREQLSTAAARRALRTLAKSGVKLVSIKRGEPFLRRDLLDLVRYGHGLGLEFSLITSGVGLTKRKIRELMALRRCTTVVFSLDGDTPAVNDRIRFRGSFDRVLSCLEEIERLRAKGSSRLIVGISHALTHANARRLPHFFHLLDAHSIQYVVIDVVQSVGAARGRRMGLTPTELRRVSAVIAGHRGQHSYAIVNQSLSPRRVPQRCNCYRGANALIDHLGYVVPCGELLGHDTSLPEHDLTPFREARREAKNILRTDLKRAVKSPIFRQFDALVREENRRRTKLKPCRCCDYRDRCRICPVLLLRMRADGTEGRIAPCRLFPAD